MSPGTWFIVGAILAAVALCIAGFVIVLIAARSFILGAREIMLPRIDLDRARATLLRLQSKAETLTALLERMRVALAQIDENVRAMIRAFSRE